MSSGEAIIKVKNLKKWFPVRKSFLASLFMREKIFVKAVDEITFEIKKGEIFVLAGESGSGKTTTGKVLVGLEKPTGGEAYFRDYELGSLSRAGWKKIRTKLQMIFQDPYESLNPRQKVFDIIAEPLTVNKVTSGYEETYDRVMRVLEEVKMIPPEEFAFRYPHQLSGGQRQRVVVARGVVLEPEFIVADEPVSMLDASIRASILDLLEEFRSRHNITFLYITHDLATARYIGDRIAIMYLGKIVEQGQVDEVVLNPQHPYTKALVSSIPVPDPEYARKKKRVELKGEIPTPINPPPGCRLHPRCPYAMDICSKEEPPEVEVERDHTVKCWLYVKR